MRNELCGAERGLTEFMDSGSQFLFKLDYCTKKKALVYLFPLEYPFG
jgi:hypothetical protein